MMDKRLEKIENYIRQYHMIEKGDRIVIGVSGGADSVCLLMALCSLQEKLGFQVLVCHVNHELRGEEAAQDEAYVEMLCHKMQVPFFAFHENVELIAKKRKESLEEAGRYVRRQAFEQLCKEQGGTKIATAHHSNDNAETVIMNLLRGSAISGLKGIEPKREEKYIRPLIDCERSQIEKYCEENNLNPRIDESNFENEYTRNKIRNICIPYIKKEFNPKIINTIKRLSETVSEEENYMQEQTIKAYNNLIISESKEEIELNLKEFIKQEKVIKRRLVLYTITKLQVNCLGIQKVNIEDIVDMCDKNIGNKYIMPNKNIKVMLKSKNLFFSINNLEI